MVDNNSDVPFSKEPDGEQASTPASAESSDCLDYLDGPELEEDLQLLHSARIAHVQLLSRWAARYQAAAEHQLSRRHVRPVDTLQRKMLSEEAQRYVIRQAAELFKLSEYVITRQITTYLHARQDFPLLTQSLESGALDMARFQRVIEVAGVIEDPEQRASFDQSAAQKAPTLVIGKLRSWLNQRVAAMGTEVKKAHREKAIAGRSVSFYHREDGVSELWAALPTLDALMIEKTLQAAARHSDYPVPHTSIAGVKAAAGEEQQSVGEAEGNGEDDDCLPLTRSAGDDRTVAQREADLLTSWLAAGPDSGVTQQAPVIGAKIAVLVPQETLTGESEAPAVTADRRVGLPAEQLRGYLAAAEEHGAAMQWYTAGYGSAEHGQSVARYSTESDPVQTGAVQAGSVEPHLA